MKFTQKAIDYLKSIRPADPQNILYVSVVGGGCSGLSYKMEWMTQYVPMDHIVEQDGLVAYTNGKSWLFLKNVEIDYTDGLNGTGFVYNNPAAKRTCGCGTSFSN